MFIAFSFAARPGKEQELQTFLDDPEAGRMMAAMMGAVRNLLFLNPAGRMVRVLEFPDNVEPTSMRELAARDPAVGSFLQRLGTLVEGLDADDPESIRAFDDAIRFDVAYDVRP